MSYTLQNPFISFVDANKPKPVGLGKLFVGLPDTDPELSPVNVYAVQPDGSELLLSQPITLTAGGVASFNGNPVQLKSSASTVSIKVEYGAGEPAYYTARYNQSTDAKNVEMPSGGNLAELEDEGSEILVGGMAAGDIANALKNIVTPENFSGDNTIQQAIDYCASIGGGTVQLKAKTYTITEPIILKRKVNLIGVDIEATIIHKVVSSEVDGIDAVVIARASDLCNNFRIENLKILGNRTSRADGNRVTTNGIYMTFAHFYVIKNVMVENCLEGFVLNQNFVAKLERITALMCQEYGFHSFNSCTTLTVSNALMWGCRGGYKVHATIYSSFRDCACDHADAGGTPDDPFLPQGSGGYYLDPAALWDVSASRFTVIGSGTENSYCRWLSGEGAFVDFINPYVFNMKGYSNEYRAIELRGIGKSRVNISNPNFDISINGAPSAVRRMYFVENPRLQTISMDIPIAGTASFGEFANPVKGVVFEDYIRILNYTQEMMVIGQAQNNFIYTSSDIDLTITAAGNVKRLNILNLTTSPKSVRVPIENSGVLELVMQGTHLSSVGLLTVRVIGDNGVSVDVIKSIDLSGVIDVRDYIFLNNQTPATTNPVFLEVISPDITDTTFFTHFELNRIV